MTRKDLEIQFTKLHNESQKLNEDNKGLRMFAAEQKQIADRVQSALGLALYKNGLTELKMTDEELNEFERNFETEAAKDENGEIMVSVVKRPDESEGMN